MASNATCHENVPLGDINWGFAHLFPLPWSLGLYAIIGAFTALALWSSIPLTIRLLFTFKRYQGLYFWSIFVTTWSLNIRAIGVLIKYTVPGSSWILAAILQELGWVGMVSGFSIVGYSRLNILVNSRRILRLVLAMIIIDGVCLHITTIVIQFGYASQAFPRNRSSRIAAADTIERLQAIWFTVQQLVISCLYVKAAWDHLQDRLQPRKIMIWLITVQILVLILDIVVVVLECAGYFVVKMIIHSFIYSIKLELEFAILNQLVAISRLGISGTMRVPPQPDSRSPSSGTTAAVSPRESGSNKWDPGEPSAFRGYDTTAIAM